MRRKEVLICDPDKAYVKALVSYLMEKESQTGLGISVIGISNEEDFENLKGNYELGFVGTPFFEETNLISGLKIANLVKLCEEQKEEDGFYKYQNMDAIDVLIRMQLHLGGPSARGNNDAKMQITGIYSPAKHELTLPFSLCVCKMISKKESVIFVDLSEIGILKILVGDSLRDFREDLIDVIYMLENKDVNGGLERFIANFEGFSVLTPVATPSQLSYITLTQWKTLFEKIEESGYRKVVVLFGSLIQGFSELAGRLQSLLVLKKNGAYYEIADRVFMEFMEKLALRELCDEVTLPMSASNLNHENLRIDALINGKLMEFVESRIGGSHE